MKSIQDFGRDLILSQDLDPIYSMLVGARRAGLLDDAQTKRWLLAYWCFYHSGVASYIASHDMYWTTMHLAAANTPERPAPNGGRWPRAPERRHFRGQKCIDAVSWLLDETPEKRVESLYQALSPNSNAPPTLKTVVTRASAWPQFGPWIGFKAADMLERVLGVPVEFPSDLGLMYEGPRDALELLPEVARELETPSEAYNGLLEHFAQYPAPPGLDRPCGPQEVETILCKWKSHVNGGYEVWKDTRELRHHLHGWGGLAAEMEQFVPSIEAMNAA